MKSFSLGAELTIDMSPETFASAFGIKLTTKILPNNNNNDIDRA
jgi:hypothetical protein